ncbi:peptidoglycan DD-metalloendopeptidase family protein [Actinocatenispora rupis]|uniref:M23ase beta-sheet core domain-containing protein n=2 Tax=Actinocatenispora rupis TaxID=519421 RepID=A0A8J3J6C0_9ACTN|nr:hypothetical protein Aru02nite_10870 [Actinocatenispora rupis]
MLRIAGAAIACLIFGVTAAVGTVAHLIPGGTPSTNPGNCTTVASAARAAPAGRWTAEQTANATVIVAVGNRMHIPSRGWVIAVATAMQESSLHNLTGGDRDSIGLFQQRPSQGWGTPTQLHDPAYAAHAFYAKLLQVKGWQTMPLTRAAQTVQQSAFPDAYATWETPATTLVAAIARRGHLPTVVASPADCDATFISPVIAPIVSGFRTDGRPDHNGVDLAAKQGTPIRAAHAGTVTVAECEPSTGNCNQPGSASTPGCGWYVDITSPDQTLTRYCHMLHRPTVHVGRKVKTGEVIGIVGQSGNADGPHLHFEIHLHKDPSAAGAVDPIGFYKARHLTLGSAQRSAPSLN